MKQLSEWGRGVIQFAVSDAGTVEIFRTRDLTKTERKR